jgi:hypothetical protein
MPTIEELRGPADELIKQKQEEYGTYVAAEQILIGTAVAFNVGDPVPKSHIEREVVSLEQVTAVNQPTPKGAKPAPTPEA